MCNITMTYFGSGTDKVCAWTKGDSAGYNYSGPYNQVGLESKNIDYSHVPDIKENVVLNPDNPVSVNYTFWAAGESSTN